MLSGPLPHRAPDALGPAARRGVLVGAALLHLGVLSALWQIEPARRTVAEVLSIGVDWIAPPAPVAAPPPPPAPKVAPPVPRQPLIVSKPVAAPADAVLVAPPPPVDQPVVLRTEPAAPAPAATLPAPPARPQPRTVAISAVQYLSAPVLNYPPASRRLHEQGRVDVRVLVDAQGLPQQTAVIRPSGFARLDEAALVTVRSTRFKPYTEDGTPLPFWVVMPLIFELEN